MNTKRKDMMNTKRKDMMNTKRKDMMNTKRKDMRNTKHRDTPELVCCSDSTGVLTRRAWVLWPHVLLHVSHLQDLLTTKGCRHTTTKGCRHKTPIHTSLARHLERREITRPTPKDVAKSTDIAETIPSTQAERKAHEYHHAFVSARQTRKTPPNFSDED